MRISIVSRRNATRDPAIRALLFSLRSVGHDVTLICTGEVEPGLPDGVTVHAVRPKGASRWGRVARRLRGEAGHVELDHALREALSRSHPELIYPHRVDDIDIADRVGVPVLRQPGWPPAEHDLIQMAPHSSQAGVSPVVPNRSPRRPGRHHGVSVVLAYRVTPTNPGRYLETALRRSGTEVTVFDGEIDWHRVSDDAACMIIVESPYPPLEVHGRRREIPVLFWVHHGEHHLSANLRLTYRYGADAVLMAHSWHLAHRFPVPVHRFPFAVAPELFVESKPWTSRRYDVVMVGAGFGSRGGRYEARRRVAAVLESDEMLSTRFAYGLTPAEMTALYGDARIVINDGGARHFPITMRVFEALGAGALLLTEDTPGLDTLFSPDVHYVVMKDDIVDQVHSLLSAERSIRVADNGHDHALRRHTYDHRVDQVLDIASRTTTDRLAGSQPTPMTDLARLVDGDVDAQQIAVFGEVDPLGLDDRAIRVGDGQALRERSIDAVIIGEGASGELKRAVLSARGYVYAEGSHTEEVARLLAAHRPEAQVSVTGDVLRADLGGSGYRMRPVDHPLAR